MKNENWMHTPDMIDRALTALANLEKIHSSFLLCLKENTSSGESPRAGEITANDGVVRAKCFGIELKCHSRPVAQSGEFVAYEYSFFAEGVTEPFRILNIYLGPDLMLRNGFVQGSDICRADNKYIGARLTDALAQALLNSRFIEPNFG